MGPGKQPKWSIICRYPVLTTATRKWSGTLAQGYQSHHPCGMVRGRDFPSALPYRIQEDLI